MLFIFRWAREDTPVFWCPWLLMPRETQERPSAAGEAGVWYCLQLRQNFRIATGDLMHYNNKQRKVESTRGFTHTHGKREMREELLFYSFFFFSFLVVGLNSECSVSSQYLWIWSRFAFLYNFFSLCLMFHYFCVSQPFFFCLFIWRIFVGLFRICRIFCLFEG